MVDKIRCKVCGTIHFRDEECYPGHTQTVRRVAPQNNGAPSKYPETPAIDDIYSAGGLPASDPLVQEFREKHGREKQEEYYPECDAIEDNYA